METDALHAALIDSLALAGAGPQEAAKIWDKTTSAYGDPSRRYHTMTHLAEMFALLAEFQAVLTDFPVCVFALIYHDMVYDSKAKDNEAQSAAMAFADLSSCGVSKQRCRRVEALVLSTAKHLPTGDGFDDLLFLDADLSILGARRDRYQAYMNAIRREYGWVKEEDYRAGRSAVLQKFLDRPRIYYTDEIHARSDRAARGNLIYEISVLSMPARF